MCNLFAYIFFILDRVQINVPPIHGKAKWQLNPENPGVYLLLVILPEQHLHMF